jgi:ABC-2 type transport system permease protein
MSSFLALLNAGFREFVRDRTALFFTLVFPLMFIFLFGLFFGQPDDIGTYAVGIVLEDPDDQAAMGFYCMFEMVDQDGENQPALDADDLNLCRPWLEQQMAQGRAGMADIPAQDEIPQLPLEFSRGSRTDEMELLREAERKAVVIFPAGFGEQVAQRMDNDGPLADVEIHYDASQTNTAQIVNQILASLLDEYDRQLAGTPRLIQPTYVSITAESLGLMDYFVPGVLAMSLMQLGIFGALTMVSLRERKILKRLGATPLRRPTLVSSQVVLRLIIALVQTVIILSVGRLAFDVQISNQYALMLVFIVLGALTFIAIGYLVASFARTEASGSAIVQVIQFPMMFLSGIFWPMELAPDWLRPVIYAMPLTYLGDALRQSMLSGSSRLFPLWVDAAVLGGWFLVSLGIAFRYFRWE